MTAHDWLIAATGAAAWRLASIITDRFILPFFKRFQHPCAEGHAWVHMGGRNAGCSAGCYCSVPVYSCERCGDCDYGDNAEAEEQIAKCKAEAEQLERDPI
jgi:hypothetical protein